MISSRTLLGIDIQVAGKYSSPNLKDRPTALKVSRKPEQIPRAGIQEQKIKSKSFRVRTALSKHNKMKLAILLSVFDKFKNADQIAQEIPRFGRDFKVHKKSISCRVSSLRHRYTHPYLISKDRVHGIVYQCSRKGKRVACELYYRQTLGLALNWDGRYKIDCPAKASKSLKFCPTCDYNPKNLTLYTSEKTPFKQIAPKSL
jgi:hypothetical protein